ncbi:hypothetical protein BJV74DRAFT_738937, partial [Russula compacta]
FHNHWDYTPYKQFDSIGDHIWSNLMSAEWATKQADEILKNPSNLGAMLVGVVAGSDNTVMSVAMGQQEFHPIYVGPGNVDNPTQQAH